jgi:hypothetical protein
MDGSGDYHKHMYISKGPFDGFGDCHMHRYIRKGLWVDLVIVTTRGKLSRDCGHIHELLHVQVY